jgi:molybdenum cofactor cytidylyltransferase
VNPTDILQNLGCILLAAGGSRRLGQPKQLVQVNGEPIVARAARNLQRLEAGPVIVVTGEKSSKIQKILQNIPVSTAFNPIWEQGMGTSISCGMKHLPDGLSGVLIALCDQWRVNGDDLDRLRNKWLSDISAIFVSKWEKFGEDGFGPPAIFPSRLFFELESLDSDRGARPLIEKNINDVTFVPMANAAYDLDEPGDLEELRRIDRKSTSSDVS